MHKINIASAKHAITKIKITGAALPFVLDSVFVACPTCRGFILRHPCIRHRVSQAYRYIHDANASVLHVTLPRVVVHELSCGTLCPLD